MGPVCGRATSDHKLLCLGSFDQYPHIRDEVGSVCGFPERKIFLEVPVKAGI